MQLDRGDAALLWNLEGVIDTGVVRARAIPNAAGDTKLAALGGRAGHIAEQVTAFRFTWDAEVPAVLQRGARCTVGATEASLVEGAALIDACSHCAVGAVAGAVAVAIAVEGSAVGGGDTGEAGGTV